MATYYVDQVDGLDTNTGTSTLLPWKTLARVQTAQASLLVGDNIYFKRGCTWREQLTISIGGAAGNPITYGAYGDGADPIINGADLQIGFNNQGGGLWRNTYVWADPGTPSVAAPEVAFFNGERGIRRTGSQTECVAPGDWYWSGNYFWTYCTQDPNTYWTSISVAARNYGFYCTYSNYVTIQDLEFKHQNHKCIALTNNRSNYIIQRITAHHNGGQYSLGFPADKHCIGCDNKCNSITIQDCHLYEPGGNCINLVNGSNHLIQNNWCWNPDHHCIDLKGGNDASGSIIRYNRCWEDASALGTGANLIVLGVDPGTASKVISNVSCYYNLLYGTRGSGILVQAYADGVTLYNNTISDCHYAISCYDAGSYTITAKNNIYYLCNSDNTAAGAVYIASSTNKSFDYDCLYFTPGIRFFQVNGVNYTNWTAFHTDHPTWEVMTAPAHAITTDPLFTDQSNNVYTLGPLSPCRNAAFNVGLTADHVGHSVPNGSAPDIGAYEWYGPAAPQNLRVIP